LKIEAVEFVRSAAGPRDLPAAGDPELAIVGRSNVGKSSLINALVGCRVARTSGTPGKTRLVNLYRVQPAGAGRFYVADLPGYGHAGGGEAAARLFASLTRLYFGRPGIQMAALLALDARHPGLENDLAAYAWLRSQALPLIVVVTKVDKLAKPERARALRRFGELVEEAVLPVSAVTGEGLDQLWRQIVRWVNQPRQKA
jgi:GTP-binding protein